MTNFDPSQWNELTCLNNAHNEHQKDNGSTWKSCLNNKLVSICGDFIHYHRYYYYLIILQKRCRHTRKLEKTEFKDPTLFKFCTSVDNQPLIC